MNKYTIEIKEQLVKQIQVIANSQQEAINKVKKDYQQENIVLYPEDHTKTDISIIDEIKLSKVDLLRLEYPKGTRIQCIYMNDSFAVPSGTIGLVDYVDDIGTIHMNWENGSSLGLILGVDSFKKKE